MFKIPQDNLAYPVLVRMPKSQGTGFFLNSPTATYLITAKHVLFKDNSLINDEIELVAIAGDLKDSNRLHIVVNLKALYTAGKIINPKGVDIVGFKIFTNTEVVNERKGASDLIPEAKVLSSPPSGFIGVGYKNVKFLNEVVIGNDVVLFGYPSSIGMISQPQIDYASPLLRKGIVAGKNDVKKTVIIDCPVFPGNSGGPVIQIDQPNFTTTTFSVIGVVSEYIPYYSENEIIKDDKAKKLESLANSGYTVVVPMDEVYSRLGIKKE